jgi:benzoyl-CoA reductase/2-hydroxyglutaryl-CoA dehydratase subunit BcrC/BadD/HgdB
MSAVQQDLRIFAYFDSSHEFPEEIVMAAGFTPYKILGDVETSNDPADQYVFGFVCPFSRSALTEGLLHSDKWAGIAICHGCDVTNNQFDIWKRHVKTDFLYWINSPANNNSTARRFHVREVRRFMEHLERQFGVQITDDKLREAIRLSNHVKALLRELASLRARRDIDNREYHALVRRALQEPKVSLIPVLERTLLEWEARPGFPEDKVPVLVTGSDLTYAQWPEAMEAAGLRMVRDDLGTGERYFAASIAEDGDPVEALVDYHDRIPQPPTRLPFEAQLDYLLKSLAETRVKGVVFQTLKFCEPHLLCQPTLVGEIKKAGYKVITLEREYTPTVDHQVISRLETFREIVSL